MTIQMTINTRITLFLIVVIQYTFSLKFDSLQNIYKNKEYFSSQRPDIGNSTWKEIVVADKLINLIKCIPTKLDNDNEIDLIVLDSETRLYWVSNIRGTSGDFNHQFISKSKLIDFVISSEEGNVNKDFFILGINSYGKKILKFNSEYNQLNNSLIWNEDELFSLDNDKYSQLYGINMIDPKIKSMNLYPISSNSHILFITINDFLGYNNLIKLTLTNQTIDNISIISIDENIKVIGGFDINKDGLIDVLYIDRHNNIYCLLNNDPYYYSIYISNLSPIQNPKSGLPRVFLNDNNHDNYPDIIIGDSIDNTIGLLFNPGKDYWNKIKLYYISNNQNTDLKYKSFDWTYIQLIDTKQSKDKVKSKLIDFTVIPSKHYIDKRINFEIFALYDKGFIWYVEKELSITTKLSWGDLQRPKNYIQCMTGNDVVVDKVKDFTKQGNEYDLIVDLDINNDGYPEFILYYEETLFLIKKYNPNLTGFGWNSSFWIYICIYVYVVCSVIGLIEFYKLSWLSKGKNEVIVTLKESMSKRMSLNMDESRVKRINDIDLEIKNVNLDVSSSSSSSFENISGKNK